MKKKNALILICFLVISMMSNLILVALLVKEDSKQKAIVPYEQPQLEDAMAADCSSEIDTFNENSYEQYLREIFSDEELIKIGKKAWDMVISVNGNEFTTNTIYTNSDSINVLVGEVRNDINIPEDIASMGKLDNEVYQLIDYIHIYTEVPYTIECEKSQQGCKYYLKFDNVDENTIITLEMSQEIKSRLHYAEKISENRLSIVKR